MTAEACQSFVSLASGSNVGTNFNIHLVWILLIYWVPWTLWQLEEDCLLIWFDSITAQKSIDNVENIQRSAPLRWTGGEKSTSLGLITQNQWLMSVNLSRLIICSLLKGSYCDQVLTFLIIDCSKNKFSNEKRVSVGFACSSKASGNSVFPTTAQCQVNSDSKTGLGCGCGGDCLSVLVLL